jgi:hypothetical protein
MFWTQAEDEVTGPAVTLCDEHALYATNMACGIFGLGPFDSMEEASVVLEATAATFGRGDVVWFESSEIGHCAECERLRREAGGDAA